MSSKTIFKSSTNSQLLGMELPISHNPITTMTTDDGSDKSNIILDTGRL